MSEQAERECFQPRRPATEFGNVGAEAVEVTVIDRRRHFQQYGGRASAEQVRIEPERVEKDKLPVERRAVLIKPGLCRGGRGGGVSRQR